MSGHAAPARGLRGRALIAAAWLWVGVPFGYGIYQLLQKIEALFSG